MFKMGISILRWRYEDLSRTAIRLDRGGLRSCVARAVI